MPDPAFFFGLGLLVGLLVGAAGMAIVYPCRRIRRLVVPVPRPAVPVPPRTAGDIMHPYEPRSPR